MRPAAPHPVGREGRAHRDVHDVPAGLLRTDGDAQRQVAVHVAAGAVRTPLWQRHLLLVHSPACVAGCMAHATFGTGHVQQRPHKDVALARQSKGLEGLTPQREVGCRRHQVIRGVVVKLHRRFPPGPGELDAVLAMELLDGLAVPGRLLACAPCLFPRHAQPMHGRHHASFDGARTGKAGEGDAPDPQVLGRPIAANKLLRAIDHEVG
mmetsp:Transcript_43065/g.136905  ORF Transcript_43065/g.136905 Transcript_43065/m.136905 type:complete len:209 (+) Transcript_43065:652-1278(+)